METDAVRPGERPKSAENPKFSAQKPEFKGKISGIILLAPRRAASVTHKVLAPRSFRWRFLTWKIGPQSSRPFLSQPLLPNIMKAVELGCSLPMEFPGWHYLAFWPTFFPTSSRT